MDWPPLVFLGRISYSLYLLHLLVLFALVRTASPAVSVYWLLPAALVLSIGLAWLSYRAVELPSIRLGRHLASPRPQRYAEVWLEPAASPRPRPWRRRAYRAGRGSSSQRPPSAQTPPQPEQGKV